MSNKSTYKDETIVTGSYSVSLFFVVFLFFIIYIYSSTRLRSVSFLQKVAIGLQELGN